MFSNIDDNEEKFKEFLESEEGQKVVGGFIKGPVPDYSSIFKNTNISELEIVDGEFKVVKEMGKYE